MKQEKLQTKSELDGSDDGTTSNEESYLTVSSKIKA